MINISQAKKIRNLIEQLSSTLNDEAALGAPQLFPIWEENKKYIAGDRVRYNDELYRCLTDHTSESSTWVPTDAPSLWTKVLIPNPEVIPEWVQPESTNPYQLNDKVTHNGKTWICTVNNNVWEPGVYGWAEYTAEES